MRDVGRISCSKEWAVPVVVKRDYVYVHTNIDVTIIDGEERYSCDERIYTPQEYIEELSGNLSDAEQALTDLEITSIEQDVSLTDLEIAVAELQEKVGE